ncbi:MAG: hypothetical protein AAF517_07965 [Planctomycetota bacterium]
MSDEADRDEGERVTHSDKKRQFPCENCGAGMAFDPKATALTCPYCDHVNELPQSEDDIEELDFHAFLEVAAENEELQETAVVKCPACGAESTFDPNITSDECAFCGTAIVTTKSTKKSLKPRSLLPFKVTRKEAGSRWTKWLSSLWFAPNALKKKASAESSLKGVYVPYWTYDSDATSAYSGERGDNYWVTETYTTTENNQTVTKTRQVQKIRWSYVSGRVWNTFDDVLVLASRSLPRKITEKLEPWDTKNLVPYADEYLSGFRAESYQIELGNGFELAKEIMDREIHDTVERDIGGDHQRVHSVKSRFSNITFKHILLPIWISAYRYEEKVYRFVVNARTGEVQGERPWSWVKITLAVLGGLAVLGAIAFAVSQS